MVYDVGQRIKMINMDSLNPISPGSKGTITDVNTIFDGLAYQLSVKWDSGKNFAVFTPFDKIQVLKDGE